MIYPPIYFERIRIEEEKRWATLLADPVIAAPWHQLFKQVQSPQHVVSELLQNADDAGAENVFIQIENGYFIFRHDGEDFSEDQFKSLCRFGYSNKRNLHNIGFRGIGFKSTFSLGSRVHLTTPTLAIHFDKDCFTKPQWNSEPLQSFTGTEIKVRLCDSNRTEDLQKSLEVWTSKSVSLLFFKSIKSLTILGDELGYINVGPGPTPNSESFRNAKFGKDDLIVVRSEAEPFPEDALAEIREERLVDMSNELTFPPCRVELVLGAEGRLHVVLPTGVLTRLPFACNAPFIQDPARLKIKDPSTSPTNRWLLNRLGRLAADMMIRWLGNDRLTVEERAKAYRLLPSSTQDNADLAEVCNKIVAEAFTASIVNQPKLLTADGQLVINKNAVGIPAQLYGVWTEVETAALLDAEQRPPLSHFVEEGHKNKLEKLGWIESLKKSQIMMMLIMSKPPKPFDWVQLHTLWSYLANDVYKLGSSMQFKMLNILPARGLTSLCSAGEIVRLGAGIQLQSAEDWRFLEEFVHVLDEKWLDFLEDARNAAKVTNNSALRATADDLDKFIRLLGIDLVNDSTSIIQKASRKLFGPDPVPVPRLVWFTQIAAKIGATVKEDFRYLTRSGTQRSVKDGLLSGDSNPASVLLPIDWYNDHAIALVYTKVYSTCPKGDWDQWVASGKAGLYKFPPLLPKEIPILDLYRRKKVEKLIRSRGFTGAFDYSYTTNNFLIEDWDFPDILWDYWTSLARDDTDIWSRIMEIIIGLDSSYWTTAVSAKAFQIGTNRFKKPIHHQGFIPIWIDKFRNLPCLPDTHGRCRLPRDLLRRTPATEGFLEVEPFVLARLDREAARPLLDALGVSSIPSGPDRILDCLRSLALAPVPPVLEVDKWYRRLDLVASEATSADAEKIRTVLGEERLILDDASRWTAHPGIFISANDEDAPGAPLVRETVRDLSLWRRIGIPDRPNLNFALDWLRSIEDMNPLHESDLLRIRALLSRHGILVVEECGRILNLLGEWVPLKNLRYSISQQTNTAYSHLFDSVKRKTADLRDLKQSEVGDLFFVDLRPLSVAIENRISLPNGIDEIVGEKPLWMERLGTLIARIQLDPEIKQEELRNLGFDLSLTSVFSVPRLKSVPYLEGTPVGTPKILDLLWKDQHLYIASSDKARLAKLIPRELARMFQNQDIAEALNYCYERPDRDIYAYMKANFQLEPEAPLVIPTSFGKGLKVDDTSAVTLHTNPLIEKKIEDHLSSVLVPTSGPGLNKGVQFDKGELESPTEGIDSNVKVPAIKPERRIKSPLIERFALGRGFHHISEQKYLHPDGSVIEKSRDSVFPWEYRSSGGELLHFYFAKDHCLELEPLEIPAEVWSMVEQKPEMHTLILATAEDAPTEMTGNMLLDLREKKDLNLFPATYRLVISEAFKGLP